VSLQNSPDGSVIPNSMADVSRAFGVVADSRPFRYDEAADLSLLKK